MWWVPRSVASGPAGGVGNLGAGVFATSLDCRPAVARQEEFVTVATTPGPDLAHRGPGDVDPAGGPGAVGGPGAAEVVALFGPLLSRLRGEAEIDPDWSALVDEAIDVWVKPGFDSLISVPRLRFTPFEYQMQAARTVLRRMQGRAILADEVGLGKTIEAGLVLSELRMRGLARAVLVITPAGLVDQWREELDRKFALPSVLARSGEPFGASGPTEPAAGVGEGPVVLASLAAARRDPLRSELTAREWDMVVVDEAHRVRNARTASGRLARGLRTRYLLLLSATPVENRLEDLFELVSLVSPGLLGTAAEFRRRHGGTGQAKSQPQATSQTQATSQAPAQSDSGTRAGATAGVRNVAELRDRTRQVMVRHRRSEVEVMLPQRLAETVLVTPDDDEAALYAAVAARVRREARTATPSRMLALRSLTRLAGSSPAALTPTLAKVGWTDLAGRAGAVGVTSKIRVLVELLRRRLAAEEKVVVFTAFRPTLDALAGALSRAGIGAAVYHGGLARADKERVIADFRDRAPVLLTTESAGEGRNLQFCHVMANVDLPWNPMQIEQRLGRLHRVGQKHDVVLTNLVGRGTIEERILGVLEQKINLFELVVGELDMILGRIDDDGDFAGAVFDAYVASDDDAEFAARLDRLGDALALARTGYLASRTAVDDLVGSGW
jgi:SNF2 family DNA or RNA helicase